MEAMEACCAAQVGRVQIMSELDRQECQKAEGGDGGPVPDDTLSWPLQPVTHEECLPPVHGHHRRRSRRELSSGGKFQLLPSVGTWLLPLPSKLAARGTASKESKESKPTKREEAQDPLPDPIPALKAEVWTAHYSDARTACEIHLHHDRVAIIESMESSRQVVLEQWLSEPTLVVEGSGTTLTIATLAQLSTQVHLSTAAEALQLAASIRSAVERLASQVRDHKWSFVYLNVYDLFNWRVSLLNRVTWLLGAGGAYHAGVEVYGLEYAFGGTEIGIGGSGITTCTPKSCHKHSFRQSLCLGVTTMSAEDVDQLVIDLAPEWPTEDYEVLGPNCITFCRCICKSLGVADVPDWVDSMVRSIKERNVIFDPSTGSADYQKGCCPQQHLCRLQSQGFLASFVEVLACSACECDIEPGLQHWHCSECDKNYCVACLVPACVR
ncbi:unnamed protein product [Symbiodinium natans]|uniref:PPPDE domain-containing protein n=1 Tax=Symbiodinium natans TaxID=878477 RepID=A0A812T5S5_9DINO|nr:unnamed protein product [Symbiodinium natans]